MKKAILFSAIAALGMVAAQSNAAVLSLTGVVSNEYDSAGNTVATNPDISKATAGDIYQIDVYVSMSGLQANQGFGNVLFNVNTADDVSGYAPYGPYAPVFPAATYSVGKTPKPYLSTNQDAGASGTDLQQIIASIKSGVTDAPIYTIGTSSPFELGSVYVLVGAKGGTATIQPIDFSTNDAGVLDDVGVGNTSMSGSSFTFVVPEPASLSLLGIGAVGLLIRRRRHA